MPTNSFVCIAYATNCSLMCVLFLSSMAMEASSTDLDLVKLKEEKGILIKGEVGK